MISISRPDIGEAEEAAVLRVLRSGRLAQGPEVAALEEEFAAMCGTAHAVAVTNGTAALHLALLAHGVGPGDEVIIPSFTFAATGNAVLACGARPVFCDVHADDFCIDVEDAAKRVTAATKAIMPVHLYGQCADMNAVRALAGARGIAVVEDACQAHGATFEGKRAGSFATAAFSLYATKNMMSGEGGIITTNDDAIATKLRLLRSHGMERQYVHVTFGLNQRMTDLHAAIGRSQLAKLAEGNAKRAENAAFYAQELSGIDGLLLPSVMPGRGHVWHQFTVRILGGMRDAVVQRLADAGVGAGIYYPTPVHRQPSFATGETLPVSEQLAAQVCSIPVHPGLTDEERAQVAKALATAVAEDA